MSKLGKAERGKGTAGNGWRRAGARRRRRVAQGHEQERVAIWERAKEERSQGKTRGAR